MEKTSEQPLSHHDGVTTKTMRADVRIILAPDDYSHMLQEFRSINATDLVGEPQNNDSVAP